MIKLSKKKFNKIFKITPKYDKITNYVLNSEFRELIITLMVKTDLSFSEVLDLIKNW